MHIISGPAAVVEHGMVTAFDAHPLRFELELGLAVEMRFVSDPARDVEVETELHPPVVVLVLTNFEEGRGSSHPVLVGEVEGDAIYLHFKVFRFGRTDDRTVHYTFYRVPGNVPGDAGAAPG